MRFKPEQMLYVRSMGKMLRVTAMFDNMADANEYMEKNRDEACVAEFKPYVLIAAAHDHGLPVKYD